MEQDKKYKKITSDINFLMKKCYYLKEKFLGCYMSTKEILEKQAREDAINQILKTSSLRFDGTHETVFESGFTSEMNNSCFFEFDSFMLECKRSIDYIIKAIRFWLGFKDIMKKGKGTESFFKSLNPDFKENRREDCIKIIKIYPDFANFLWYEWGRWIKKLHKYRTISVHNYIPNHVHGKIKVFWNSVAQKDSPSEVTLDGIFLDGENIEDYVKKTLSDLASFDAYVYGFSGKIDSLQT